MSLVTLTFGYGKEKLSHSEIVVNSPADAIHLDPNIENTAEILKITQFYGEPEVYIVTKIQSGALKPGMSGTVNGKPFLIEHLDSKYKNIGKQGMTVGLSISGLQKEDFEKGAVLHFTEGNS